MIKKILGPPGTGKTFTLLNHVKEYIKKGTPLHRIGYFAFTRKAAYNARDTFLEDGNFKDVSSDLTKSDLKFFQTLHSFSFHTLGLSEDRVMQPEHYEEIGRLTGVRVKYTKYNGRKILCLIYKNNFEGRGLFLLLNKVINHFGVIH